MRYDMRNTADFKKLPVYSICKDNGSGPKFQIFPVLIFAAARHVSHKPFIPPYPAGRTGTESLNVAVATAVVCAEFRWQADTKR